MFLDEALKATREDESIEMSWGNKWHWCSFEEFFNSEVVKNDLALMTEDGFCIRKKKPTKKEKQFCSYCGKKLD